MAWHVSRDFDKNLAPPRRTCRAETQLHHSRHRRSDPPAEAGAAGRRISTTSAGRRARSRIRIDAWKNRGLDACASARWRGGGFANGKGAALYELYQERLKILNAADFGDLLLESLRLFRENPDVLADSIRTASDIFSSTNIRTPTPRNICGCGCSRRGATMSAASATTIRSIYGWRGAEVENILRFEKRFSRRENHPAGAQLPLDRTYSRRRLAGLISHNEGRLGKTLFTDGDDGEKPTVTGVWDSEEEARVIGEEIEQLQRKGHALEEIAILVRASFQMREFEERFITLGLPYRVIGGPRFYERLEIRDALAYLRCVAQPADDLAFERIYQYAEARPRRRDAADAA